MEGSIIRTVDLLHYFFANKPVDQCLSNLLKYKITFLIKVDFLYFISTLSVQGIGHPITSGMCCRAAILCGYSESCTGVIKDIISQKGVATGWGVGTEWAYMYKTVF